MLDLLTLSAVYAHGVADLLERNGVQVSTGTPFISEGVPGSKYVTLRVASIDAPRAIKILETLMFRKIIQPDTNDGGKEYVLIPVDYTDKTHIGLLVGFGMAKRLRLTPVLLHSYMNEPDGTMRAFSDEAADAAMVTSKEELIKFNDFADKVDSMKASGELIDLEYERVLSEGIPEECILSHTKNHAVRMIVMPTRTSKHRISNPDGSVTAEVLDSCRVPLFTVPENYDFKGIASIRKVTFFCNFDRYDYISMEGFMDLFSKPSVEITLMPGSEKLSSHSNSKMKEMRDRFARLFPNASFTVTDLEPETYKKKLRELAGKGSLELIVTQNRKRNIFKRLVTPGLAHMIFYELDAPMLVWPV